MVEVVIGGTGEGRVRVSGLGDRAHARHYLLVCPIVEAGLPGEAGSADETVPRRSECREEARSEDVDKDAELVVGVAASRLSKSIFCTEIRQRSVTCDMVGSKQRRQPWENPQKSGQRHLRCRDGKNRAVAREGAAMDRRLEREAVLLDGVAEEAILGLRWRVATKALRAKAGCP